ncbi:MAG: hypothetical protein RL510_783 [Actinomycetota bacterium]
MSISKKFAAIVSAAAVVASGVFVAAPAQAETTQAALTRLAGSIVERKIDPVTKEVKFRAGDNIQLSWGGSFKLSALEANIQAGDKLVVDPGVNVVTGSAPTGTRNYVNINYYIGQTSGNSSTLETTFSGAPTSIYANINYNGVAASDVTLTLNPTFTVDGYTFVADDFNNSNVNASTGYFMPGSRNNAPVVGREIDDRIIFDVAGACVDLTGIVEGDVLEATYDLSDGTGPITNSGFASWAVRNDQGMSQGGFGEGLTYTVPVIQAGYKLSLGGSVYVEPVVEGKTYSFNGVKVVKQGSTTNLLTHCKETKATGVLTVTGSTVTGTLTTTADSSGMMGGFDSYACMLYAATDTNFATVVKSGSASRFGMNGPVANPTCNIANVAAGTYKLGIRGYSYNGVGSEKILDGTVTVAGSVTPPAKKAPKLPTVATKVKAGKFLTIALHATKGTAKTAANADGLVTKVALTAASKGYCSLTPVIKSKKITGYTVKGLKVHAAKCAVTLTVTGNASFNSVTKTIKVAVTK